ncbi:TetR/AcrR family transcriptional regulator [Rhodococcus sp. KRD162]|jgi:AcrR family transcriptional regulator|uniref:TetR family transcriptional regulator n=1 Tax=Rhodococcus baikonurensis TaxID=172041 RepID=A0ABV5XK82_9NOCA|nr:TetR/AcrR family transcriptional regulator [Rhodococcus sp. KRD162]
MSTATATFTFAHSPCIQPRAKVTREKVLDETAHVFDALGYFPASITEMLNGSDLTKGAIFYHFPSKEAIAQQLVEDWIATIEAEFADAATTQLPATTQLRAVFEALADIVTTSVRARAGMKLILERAVSGGVGAYRRWVSATDAVFAAAITRAEVSADVDSRRRAWNLCAGFTVAVLLEDIDGDDLDVAARVDDLLTMHLAFAH